MRVPKNRIPPSSVKRTVPVRPVRRNMKAAPKTFDRRILFIIGIAAASIVLVLFSVFTIRAILSGGKTTPDETEAVTAQSADLPVSDMAAEGNCVVKFGDPQINGTSEAIIYAELISQKNGYSTFGFEIYNEAGELVFEGDAQLLDGGLYAKAGGLEPETQYTVRPYCLESETKLTGDVTMTFTTPARVMSLSEVEKLVEGTCPRSTDAMTEETKTLFHAHAIMKLLGMYFDETVYERMETLTQVNQVMLDYSLNSYNNFVFWNNINETPTKESVALLKDILSVNPDIKKDDIIKDFTISPYSMTPYVKYDNFGGQISSEDYVFDIMKDDQNASVYFATEYPYIVDTPEFQEKYADLINGYLEEDSDEMKSLISQYGKETFDQSKDVMLEAIAAKNKVYFADICAWWLEEIAVLPEKRIYIYSESGRHSMDSMLAPTMVAFAYMYDEFREQTGLEMTVNNSYRSCETQWDKYSKGYGKSQVLAWSGLWHLDRQIVSYVPGYSNHQFAVSVDFEPAQYVFIESEAYKYLEKNAGRYGFYNYSLETWHWTYLGVQIPEETIESIPLATPLADE